MKHDSESFRDYILSICWGLLLYAAWALGHLRYKLKKKGKHL